MREIGGYIELDTYHLPMLHDGAIALNCGRNCLAYLFRSRKIQRIKIPCFICASIPEVCNREEIEISYYHIGKDFKPTPYLCLKNDEWLYLINYYGQLSNEEIQAYKKKYKRVIVDQVNSYFQTPLEQVDTIYSCRKYFGVADGAFLYTDTIVDDYFPIDESFDRMKFLLGRFERPATDFYEEYKNNNKAFTYEPIKYMSKLTRNLLHGIDYKAIEEKRKANFEYLHSFLKKYNQLDIKQSSFMYPFMIENGELIRKRLQLKKIYIPLLWPYVLKNSKPNDIEYKMANNILPLPIDQRYNTQHMDNIVRELLKCIS